MIEQDFITVVPAYGRDYETAEQAISDWEVGKDFRISDISCPANGCYISRRDGRAVKIRYHRFQRFVIVKESRDARKTRSEDGR